MPSLREPTCMYDDYEHRGQLGSSILLRLLKESLLRLYSHLPALAFPDSDLLDDKLGDLLPRTRYGSSRVPMKGRDSSDSYSSSYTDSDSEGPQIAVVKTIVNE